LDLHRHAGIGLNYFGQGAMLIENPAAISNPFYLMAPAWSLWPLVILATAATVIASQAVISGVFSVTTQAVSLGLLPRLRVEHSSADNAGQIYVPTMNWILMVAALALVMGFGSSAALAGAYGLAVSGAMTIVTPLTLSLIKSRTGKDSRALRTGCRCCSSSISPSCWPTSPSSRTAAGCRWYPGSSYIWLMQTWQSGRASLMARLLREQKPVRDFLEDLKLDPPVRVAGTSIFLDAKASGIPRALLNNIKFNRVMHERVVLLTVVTREQPRIPLIQAPDRDSGVRGHRAGGGADRASWRSRTSPRFCATPKPWRALRTGANHLLLEPRGTAAGPAFRSAAVAPQGIHADGAQRAGDRRLLRIAAQSSGGDRDPLEI
jgi:KUP system potassium uptake protein